jgi:hypothetical protein
MTPPLPWTRVPATTGSSAAEERGPAMRNFRDVLYGVDADAVGIEIGHSEVPLQWQAQVVVLTGKENCPRRGAMHRF